jgi:hypothetical protein
VAQPDDSFLLQFGNSKPLNPRLLDDLTIKSPNNLAGRNFQDYIESMNWNDTAFVKKVERGWRDGPRYMHCAAHGGIRIQNPVSPNYSVPHRFCITIDYCLNVIL